VWINVEILVVSAGGIRVSTALQRVRQSVCQAAASWRQRNVAISGLVAVRCELCGFCLILQTVKSSGSGTVQLCV
jgi:hypothetical protein